MVSTMTSKGQVTIPKPFRDRLGLEAGQGVSFRLNEAGEIVVERGDGVRPKSKFDAVRGIAGPGLSTDELMALLRGED